jgi:hypothetical protein
MGSGSGTSISDYKCLPDEVMIKSKASGKMDGKIEETSNRPSGSEKRGIQTLIHVH